MQTITEFIVEIPNKTKDTISIAGKEIYLASKFNEFENRIPYGKVITVPKNCKHDIEAGDTIWFHHTITSNESYVVDSEKNYYRVRYTPEFGYNCMVYLYQKSDGSFHTFNDWVFVSPPKDTEKEKKLDSGIIVKNDSEKNTGYIAIGDEKQLKELGLEINDKIIFSKNSDCPMDVDGEIIWRMRMNDLICKFI